jgi:hypothetical protein
MILPKTLVILNPIEAGRVTAPLDITADNRQEKEQ